MDDTSRRKLISINRPRTAEFSVAILGVGMELVGFVKPIHVYSWSRRNLLLDSNPQLTVLIQLSYSSTPNNRKDALGVTGKVTSFSLAKQDQFSTGFYLSPRSISFLPAGCFSQFFWDLL